MHTNTPGDSLHPGGHYNSRDLLECSDMDITSESREKVGYSVDYGRSPKPHNRVHAMPCKVAKEIHNLTLRSEFKPPLQSYNAPSINLPAQNELPNPGYHLPIIGTGVSATVQRVPFDNGSDLTSSARKMV
jgi:hypothetical protein